MIYIYLNSFYLLLFIIQGLRNLKICKILIIFLLYLILFLYIFFHCQIKHEKIIFFNIFFLFAILSEFQTEL